MDNRNHIQEETNQQSTNNFSTDPIVPATMNQNDEIKNNTTEPSQTVNKPNSEIQQEQPQLSKTSKSIEFTKENSGGKDFSEINLEQNNTSGTTEKQENNANLHLDEVVAKQLIITVQQITDGQQPLHFHEFNKKNYTISISGLTQSYISFQVKAIEKKTLTSRIAIINSNMNNDPASMAAIETIITQVPGKPDIYSYTLDRPALTFDIIINSFQKERIQKAKQNKSAILIVYGHKDYSETSGAILKSVLHQGGIADALTNSLKAKNLFIIFLCNELALYRRSLQEQLHPLLLNISSTHLYLYEKLHGKENFLSLIELVEIAISQYGWLSKLATKEQQEKMYALIHSDQLELSLRNLIDQTDNEEQKTIMNLAQSPINRIVLLTTTFFEDVNITEYDRIVRCLCKEINPSSPLTPENNLLATWNDQGDIILSNCGIIRHSIFPGFGSYRFENLSRKKNMKRLFTEQFCLQLIKVFEILSQSFLLGKEKISESMLNGISELALINATTDQDTYLLQTSFKLVEELERIFPDQGINRDYFSRILYITREWSLQNEYSSYLRRFCHGMTQTTFRRNILGAILTYLCIPSQPEKLVYLKSLLSAAGKEEYFIKKRISRIILFNYLESPRLLFNSIISWNDGNEKEKPAISYSLAQTSLLLEFYERRFSWTKPFGLDYMLIKRLTREDSEDHLAAFISFMYPVNGQTIFNLVFDEIISQQVIQSNFLYKARTESFFSMHAFILVRIHFLLDQIREENRSISVNNNHIIRSLLLGVKENYKLKPLLSALYKAIKKYNYLIRIETESATGKNKNRKAIYKSKRDSARFLIQEIEQMNQLQ